MIYPDISSFCWWTSFFFWSFWVIHLLQDVASLGCTWIGDFPTIVRQFWQCQILLFWQLCLFVNYMYVLTRPFTMHYVTLCINMHFFTGFFLKRSSCLLSSAVAATHPWFIGLCLNLWGPPQSSGSLPGHRQEASGNLLRPNARVVVDPENIEHSPGETHRTSYFGLNILVTPGRRQTDVLWCVVL